jgi:hypothetical protein
MSIEIFQILAGSSNPDYKFGIGLQTVYATTYKIDLGFDDQKHTTLNVISMCTIIKSPGLCIQNRGHFVVIYVLYNKSCLFAINFIFDFAILKF